jgi:hypothetical protein
MYTDYVDDHGGRAGFLRSDGVIMDEEWNQVGTVDTPGGTVRDRDGHILGDVDRNGTIRNSGGQKVGRVSFFNVGSKSATVYNAREFLVAGVVANTRCDQCWGCSSSNPRCPADSSGIVDVHRVGAAYLLCLRPSAVLWTEPPS